MRDSKNAAGSVAVPLKRGVPRSQLASAFSDRFFSPACRIGFEGQRLLYATEMARTCVFATGRGCAPQTFVIRAVTDANAFQ